MPQKVTITGVYYTDLLHKLRLAIKEKRRGKLTQVPLLLHNKAKMHVLWPHARQCTPSCLTCWTSCYTWIQIWRNASPTIFSWPGTEWLPSVSKFEATPRPMSSSMRPKSGWRSSQNSSISQALRNFDNTINCSLTKAVITLKNKCMLINLFLLYIGQAQNFLTDPRISWYPCSYCMLKKI